MQLVNFYKISVFYVFDLNDVLFFMHFLLWIFPIYVACIYLLLFHIIMFICRTF
jgi:hypothetical protein